MLDTFEIDSNTNLLTVTEMSNHHQNLSESEKNHLLLLRMKRSIYFSRMLSRRYPSPRFRRTKKLKPLKCVLIIETSSEDNNEKRYHALIVSASNRYSLPQWVHGHEPTVLISTIHMHCFIFPTWIEELSKTGWIVVFCLDATKAFMQSPQSKWLMVYQPPQEFLDAYSPFASCVLGVLIQVQGGAEAGLYWFKTVVTWLIG